MAERLYSQEVLALAVSLARWPLDDTMAYRAAARSATCGSSLVLSLAVDDSSRIAALGIQAQACAIGQASAALFAAAAKGCSLPQIEAALAGIDAWLAGDGPLPCWPGLAAIAPARDYPARHGAIRLSWQAARDALSSAPNPS